MQLQVYLSMAGCRRFINLFYFTILIIDIGRLLGCYYYIFPMGRLYMILFFMFLYQYSVFSPENCTKLQIKTIT